MEKNITLILILVIGTLTAYSQEVSGIVNDAKYDTPLPDVSISITDSPYGAVSGKDGAFKILGVKPGNYTLRASRVGHQLYVKEIQVSEKGLTGVEVFLQPTSINLNNEIVISARRIETDEYSMPEALTVLNSQLLEQEQARIVPEVLMGSTGVFVQKTNHGGGSPIIRGFIGNQNLLMVDGIRLNNATYRYGPNQYLSTIDPMIVQRMEVVRGAGSVMYGSDAMGGVVQVITKDPAFSNNGFKAGGSLFGKWMSEEMEKTGRAELKLAGDKVAFIGGYTYHDFGDIVAGEGIGKESPTGYTEYSFDGKLRIKLPKNNELILVYQKDQQDNVPRYDKIITGYTKYHFDPQIRQLGYLRLKTNFENKWFRQVNFTASLNQSDETRVLQKEGQTKVTDEHDLVNTYGGNIEVVSYPWDNWTFNSGVEYYYDKVNSEKIEKDNGTETEKRGYYPDGATSGSIAVYTSHTLRFNDLAVIIGARFNTYSIKSEDKEFGDIDVTPTALVGSLSAVYDLNENYKVIGSIYSAFRAPNINDMSSFGSFNYGIEVPNPDLDPEKSLNFEVGLKSKYEKFSGSLFLFRSQISDLIERAPATYNGLDSLDSEKVYKKENVSKAFIQGIEGELQYEIVTWLSAYGNLTYTYGQNETSDEPLTRIPPFNGKIGLYYTNRAGVWSRLEWLTAAKQDRLSSADEADTRIPEGGTPGWNVFNLRAGYNWKWLELSAGWNNILNEAYRTHGSGVDGYGSSVWLAIKVGF